MANIHQIILHPCTIDTAHVFSVKFLGFLFCGSSLCLSLVVMVLSKYSFKPFRALPLCEIEFLVSDGISAYLWN